MTIHIFNPEHDLALAANITNFTAPHAGRQLRCDLGYLPALWAQDGDYILVDDKVAAYNGYRKLKLNYRPEVTFVDKEELAELWSNKYRGNEYEIKPWGWNITLCDKLEKAGVPRECMPTKAKLDSIRELSNRRLAVKLLDHLKNYDGVTGFSRVCYNYEEVLVFLDNNKDIVVKAPWSSSGRGVKYMERETVEVNALQWVTNTIQKQHSIVAEKKCHKVHDFAVEFMAYDNGCVKACGLSLFTTERTAYTGNRLEKEEEKRAWLFKYIKEPLFNSIVEEIETFLAENINGLYVGPLGVDMMIVAGEQGFLLNPCIEINLRCTMGHVALALSRHGHTGMMQIAYEGGAYKLKIKN